MIENKTLLTKTNSVDLNKINKAEITIFKHLGIIDRASITLKSKGVITPYRDDIDINDIEILEDYFINNNINYFIIDRNQTKWKN